MDRAYSTLEIKAVDSATGKRTFTGIASTPSTDRMGDIVMPEGAVFKLPIALLWQHDSSDPIGWIHSAKVTAKGIEIEGEVADIPDEGPLKARLLQAWQMLKAKLVRGLSIGFNAIESARIDGTYGLKFLKWEWLELSAVTIPANQDASITSIKSIDTQLRAASGQSQRGFVTLANRPGVSGKSTTPETQRTSMKTIAEQIADWMVKRQNSLDRQTAIMTKANEAGRTLEPAEAEEYDGLAPEVAQIDAHLVRLRAMETASKSAATVLPGAADQSARTAAAEHAAARAGSPTVLSVRRNLLPGAAFTRYAMVLAQAKGNLMQAEVLARRFDDTTPEVGLAIKAAVAAGTTQDTTWAAPLVQLQDMQSEFIEFLRPMTLLGNIPGIRRVPFNIKFTRQTSGTTGTFVGEGLPKPLGKMDFDLQSMTWAKAATIIVMTEELVRFSSPSAEALARDDLAKGIATFLDRRFIDPSFAGVANVSPASITNSVTPIPSSGSSIAAIDADISAAFLAMSTANLDMGSLVWIMNPAKALKLAMKRNTDGTRAYPDISIKGGSLYGYPVIVSNNVSLTGSPTDSFAVLLDPTEIMLADDGGVSIDMSTEASVQMSDTPAGGATTLVSLWQANMVGLRAERFINWRKRRDAAVQVISNVDW